MKGPRIKRTPAKHTAVLLLLLCIAFVLRVLGQALVAFTNISFLPPMEQWYSGLIPYPVLLPIQIMIIALQVAISRDIWRGEGLFSQPSKRWGQGLRWFSFAYALSMLVRYVVTIALVPERRWFSGSIPIFFHFVLAVYLYLLAQYHRRGIAKTGPLANG